MQHQARARSYTILIPFAVACALFFVAGSVHAYTGSFGISPTILGPDHQTNTMYDIDTVSQNPQEIVTTGLVSLEKIIVETNSGQTGPMHVKEDTNGSDPAFSITVPQYINDDLVQATIYFWGPNVPSINIYHYHVGEPTETIAATQYVPLTARADGMVLWYFQTPSFSSFFIGNPKPEKVFPWIAAFSLLTLMLVPCVVLRKR